MNGAIKDCSEFAEIDPSGRYGRYDDILGKGASKTVYRAFDEYEGIEVAWNQVKLRNFTRNPEDLQKFFREIHLLKTLNHENIMKFYSSWVDTNNLSINFVTELFTSGTLRQYRLRHRRVNIKAVKQWCRQILKGLLYLHTRSPPIIHRDLKCDNIFINGHQGEVKIGDLGLAAILRKTHAVRCVGTPEFMAPELYDEEYNELVDIYAFGMCVLEMVTLDFPYSECTHPAQIYKKVISGKKPEAYYLVKEPEVRDFVDKCLATVACRLTALELLQDPFLQDDGDGFDIRPIDYYNGYDEAGVFFRQPLVNEYGDFPGFSVGDSSLYHPQICEIDLFADEDNENVEQADISIKGKKSGDDGIFLRLRIADAEGRIRNIYFPFEIAIDTAQSVAAEMVSELDIVNQDVAKIAEMIDAEITALVPDWKNNHNLEESLPNGKTSEEIYENCASIGYKQEIVSTAAERSRDLDCSDVRSCSSIHGRFEEITYKVGEQEDCGNVVSEISWCSENEMRRELRWLKARQTLQLTRVRDQSLGRSRFDVGSLAPSPLHRAISLPVDAVDI